MTLGRGLRAWSRLLLGAALMVAAASAWQSMRALKDEAKGMTRYVRVDTWNAQQVEHDLLQVNAALAEHVAGDQTVDLANVRERLNILASSIMMMQGRKSLDEEPLMLKTNAVFAELQRAIDHVRALIGKRQDFIHDTQLLTSIKQELARSAIDLRQLIADLTHVRLTLQDRDLNNVNQLIGLNHYMLGGFLGLSALCIGVVLTEARAARGAERRAVADRNRFQDIAEIASDWLWETNEQLALTYVSEQIELSTGMAAQAHLGKRLIDLASQHAKQPSLRHYLEATAEHRPFRDVVCEVGAGGEGRRTLRLFGKPYFDDRGGFLGYRGVGSDITAEIIRDERIRFLAEHDQLTRLPNRAFFQAHLQAVLDSERGGDVGGLLLALDLDGFKDINDTFGHDAGDALIVAVAERIKELIRANDLLARLGGDEFAIVQTGLDNQAAVETDLAERLLGAFATPFSLDGKVLAVGASIGIARFPEDGSSIEDLMKAADLALYSAKARGRGCFDYFDPKMTDRLKHRKTLENALREAVERGSLELHFQPQVDLTNHALIGAEALVRWHHSELGRVPPDVFVGVAEETGLILPMGQWILETACAEAATWPSLGIEGVVAVNVSPAQFIHQDLVAAVESALKKTGLPPQGLELEITEGLLMGDTDRAIGTLNQLRDMGVQLAIDDFGTGYSSLSYLKLFNVHKVKIDRSFVIDLEHSDDDRRIVNAVVMLGQALNLETIAEGVETPMQSQILASLHCDQAQGYLFGKPMAADQFQRFCLHSATDAKPFELTGGWAGKESA